MEDKKETGKDREILAEALWKGFAEMLYYGNLSISNFAARTIRRLSDDHILKVDLSNIITDTPKAMAELSYDIEDYYERLNVPPIPPLSQINRYGWH